jgi:hypothetical protein
VYQFEIENCGMKIAAVFAVFMDILKKERGNEKCKEKW